MNDNYIFDVKPNDATSPVKAYADVTIVTERGEITITGFKVIQSKNNETFVAMPAISIKDDTGNYKNVRKISTSRLFQNFVSESILSKYQELTA